ncbi:hypothetical protein EBF03_04110 [Arcanobacterium haemolyticum]|uniref:GTP-binding protein HSR1-related protein n=1 Tax=Arcanobacterium haemolyticum (strain ATCC 9345 / DSM 20595 / CCM 5947 / CCUG 17215 / LMG 16163 / NBRC 15585 / NCTC 8452 / 11018) TaxID=644284 RepID=D7BNR1_ARCHD|nr:dynamin family protein [Arcanobacterium haemolyticum]ADH92560.1 GTP-binding protein HSR1-related protein [Arcanobacterium haemolyticum DSM 20595]QCX46679.1 hypothetical protein EBF03_04110 [Arcanobacterium haemolyticum]SQH28706.1 GTPase Era [Arcanobacterium haemolyticum]
MSLTLNSGVEMLRDVVTIAEPYLSHDVVEHAATISRYAGERREHNPDVCVVAIAGSTGSGKSSIVNALIGENLARVAATRPTTAQPCAVSTVQAHDLLSWLDITQRFERPGLKDAFGATSDFVIVDLPDIDSTSAANRAIAASIIGAADVVLWIVDPQKYADAVVHDDYLAQRSEHSTVMLTVLNQADRLSATETHQVVDSLTAIMRDRGVTSNIHVASALTGDGIADLRSKIADLADNQHAATAKLAADIRTIGREIGGDLQADGGKLTPADTPDSTRLINAAIQAAGAHTVARLAGESYAYRAKKATRWPLTRWITNMKVDPLQRFRLGTTKEHESFTPVTGIERSDVALRQAENECARFISAATCHMPRRWANDVAEESDVLTTVVRRADYVSSQAQLEAERRPLWWRIINLLQWVLIAVVITGGVWLGLRALALNLGLWLERPPMIGIVPLPLVLVAAGVALGWILSLASRFFAARGQRATQTRVIRRLRKEFAADITQHVIAPILARVDEYDRTIAKCQQLTTVN